MSSETVFECHPWLAKAHVNLRAGAVSSPGRETPAISTHWVRSPTLARPPMHHSKAETRVKYAWRRGLMVAIGVGSI